MKFAKTSQKLALLTSNPKTFFEGVGPDWIEGIEWAVFPFQRHLTIINTSTTIITFLMVFLIQNTQNRDTEILHLRIDKLLLVTKEVQNARFWLEALNLKQLEALRRHYRALDEGEVSTLKGWVTKASRNRK